jgi:hypothetical protein
LDFFFILENQNGGKLQKQIYNDGFEGKYFEDICTDNSLVLKYFSLKKVPWKS